MNKLRGILKGGWEPGYWLLAAAVFCTLILTAGLQENWGSTAFDTLSYLTDPVDPLFVERGYPDQGSLADEELRVTGSECWKQTNFYGDAVHYLIQARTLRPTVAPYSLRMMVPLAAGGLHRLTGVELTTAFLLINIAAVLAAALIFTAYLRRFHAFQPWVALLGGALFILSSAVLRSLPYPMLDSVCMLFIILIFWAVRSGNVTLFLIYSLLGVLTKSVLAVGALLWPIVHWPGRKAELKQWLFALLPPLGPVMFFLGVRLVMSERIDTVNRGFHLLQGEIPGFFQRLFNWGSLKYILLRLALSFTFLWLGLANLGRDRFLRQAFFTVVVPVTVAALLFSSRIIRPLGILYPVIIPLFLLFTERLTLGSSANVNDIDKA